MGFDIRGDSDPLHVVEFRREAGTKGPDPHIHHEHSDAFYVLEGTVEMLLGPDREVTRVGPGAFVLAPPGVVHTFRVPESGDAHFLNFHAPGKGFAAYMRGEAETFDTDDPPAGGGRPASDALVSGPLDGERLTVGPNSMRFRTTGREDLGLIEGALAGGAHGPPPHVHERMVDSFFVLEGELVVRLGDEERRVAAGGYAYVPPGTPHTFANGSDGPARFMSVVAPGGFENYLRELSAHTWPVAPDVLAELSSRYDIRPA